MKKILLSITSVACVLGMASILYKDGSLETKEAFVDPQDYASTKEVKEAAENIFVGEIVKEESRKSVVGAGHYLYEDNVTTVKVVEAQKGNLQSGDIITVIEPSTINNQDKKSLYYVNQHQSGDYVLTGKSLGKQKID